MVLCVRQVTLCANVSPLYMSHTSCILHSNHTHYTNRLSQPTVLAHSAVPACVLGLQCVCLHCAVWQINRTCPIANCVCSVGMHMCSMCHMRVCRVCMSICMCAYVRVSIRRRVCCSFIGFVLMCTLFDS